MGRCVMCEMAVLKTNTGTQIHVADIKKTIIERIILIASVCKEIDYIILFGSSLENKCTERSDIDIAIISNTSRSKFLRSKSYSRFTTALYNIDEEQCYDILQFNSMEDLKKKSSPVCRDIVNKGKIIYRRVSVRV